jgi:hypothetical protein
MTITISNIETPTIERILSFLQRENVPYILQTTNETPPTQEEFLSNFKDSLLWAKDNTAGKVTQEQSFDDFLDQLENEVINEHQTA